MTPFQKALKHATKAAKATEASRAEHYVPLYDILVEIVTAIQEDGEASRELKALARRGRKVLNEAKRAVKL